ADPGGGEGPKEPRAFNPGPSRHRFPPFIGERVWHPHVAPIRLVLDDDQPPAGPQHAMHGLEHGILVADEMQRVGHQHTVQVMKTEWAREVGDPGFEAAGDALDGTPVLVYRDDV